MHSRLYSAHLIIGGFLKERIEVALKIIQSHIGELIDLNKPPVDVLILKKKNSIGIEEVRNLKKFFSLRPYQTKVKIGLILEGDKLTLPAQNSLLKTLEEPPMNSLIILLTPKKEALLPTIISRCRIIKLPSKPEIELDKESFNSHLKILEDILISRVGERIKLSISLIKDKKQALILIENMIFIWRQILLAKIGIKKIDFKLLSKLNLEQIYKAIKLSEQTRKMLTANVNFHLAIENFFLSLPYF